MDTQSNIDLRPLGPVAAFLDALREFFATLANVWVWGRLAIADIEFRYRRTILGPFWIMGATLALALSLGYVYSGVFNQNIETYLPYLTIGVVYWAFISGTITEGCSIFVASSSLIKSTAVDLPTHIFRHIFRNFIILIHNFAAIVLVWFYFRWTINFSTLMFIPGLLVGLFFATGLTFSLAMICTRYRDVQQIVISIMQLIFFITPIFWLPSALRPGHGALMYNPFYYMLEIVRAPLLGHTASGETWGIAIALAAASFATGAAIYAAYRHRLTYWL